MTFRVVQPTEGREASAAETCAAERVKERDTSAVIATSGEDSEGVGVADAVLVAVLVEEEEAVADEEDEDVGVVDEVAEDEDVAVVDCAES